MFNPDQPVKTHAADLLGRASFAQSLCSVILRYQDISFYRAVAQKCSRAVVFNKEPLAKVFVKFFLFNLSKGFYGNSTT
jgi:hypothetical protein